VGQVIPPRGIKLADLRPTTNPAAIGEDLAEAGWIEMETFGPRGDHGALAQLSRHGPVFPVPNVVVASNA
jgi:hypothetical protein